MIGACAVLAGAEVVEEVVPVVVGGGAGGLVGKMSALYQLSTAMARDGGVISEDDDDDDEDDCRCTDGGGNDDDGGGGCGCGINNDNDDDDEDDIGNDVWRYLTSPPPKPPLLLPAVVFVSSTISWSGPGP